MEQTLSAGRTIPTDLNCHGSPVTTSRAGAAAGHARLNMSRTDCLFTQRNDKDGSFRVPPAPKCARGGTQTSILQHRHTLTLTQLSMIDGKRHKGQQSAGLHLDRTQLLLHHLDSGDGADPNRSFPTLAGLLYTARVSNCFKGLVL